MPKAVSILLRCLGIKRPRPKTRAGRYLRRSEHCVTVLLIAYLGLQVFPQVLFAHSLTVEGLTIHSREPLPEEAAASLREAVRLMQASEVGDELGRENIFVCGSPGLLRLFNPRGAAVFGVSVPLTNHVFLAAADYETDTARRFGDDHNSRRLSGLIAHEVTHGLLRERLGVIRNMRLPTWVKEGYCEYVSQDGSFPEEEGRRLFQSGEGHPSHSYRYFVYRQLVQYLLDERKLSFSELVAGPHDDEAITEELRAYWKRQ